MTWYKRKWMILSILTAIWMAFTVAYPWLFVHAGPTSTRTFEIVRFAFLSISAFGVLFSVLLSSFNSLEATENISTQLAFQRSENSFSYLTRWDSEPMRSARDFTRALRKDIEHLSPKQIRERVATDKELERSAISMFNYFEEVELSISSKRVDEQVLARGFKQLYPDIYDRFKPWLDDLKLPDLQGHLASLRRRWTT